jgi:hypothetical protein
VVRRTREESRGRTTRPCSARPPWYGADAAPARGAARASIVTGHGFAWGKCVDSGGVWPREVRHWRRRRGDAARAGATSRRRARCGTG